MTSVCGKTAVPPPDSRVHDDDGLLDLDAARDVDEGAVQDEGLVEGGELGRAQLLGLRHEVLPEEVRVLG
jgi:hypothetical protein